MKPMIELEKQDWLHAPSPTELGRQVDRLCCLVVVVGCIGAAGWALFFWAVLR
jgi:hypothetical protein